MLQMNLFQSRSQRCRGREQDKICTQGRGAKGLVGPTGRGGTDTDTLVQRNRQPVGSCDIARELTWLCDDLEGWEETQGEEKYVHTCSQFTLLYSRNETMTV